MLYYVLMRSLIKGCRTKSLLLFEGSENQRLFENGLDLRFRLHFHYKIQVAMHLENQM